MNTEQKLLPALLTCFVCACLFCTPVWAGDNAEFFLLFDLLNPHKGAQNNPATVFKLHYITNDKLQTDSGISIQVQKTDAHEIGLFYIKQNIINFYSHLDFIGKRIIASGFYVTSRLANPSGHEITGNFVNAYPQYEQDIFTHWTAYGRVENAWGKNDDPYLALFPGFINRQVVTGLGYDFTKSQAVNLEYSDARKVSNKFSSLTLQWSAIFP